MVDNFDLIKPLLTFDDQEDFYYLEVLKRSKDGNKAAGDNHCRLVKDFFIYSVDYLEKKKDEIIKLCEDNNARAYLRLRRRNNKQVALKLMSNLATKLSTESFMKNPVAEACSAIGTTPDKKQEPRWLIDIDYDEEATAEACRNFYWDVMDKIAYEYPNPGESKFIAAIPTKHGIHIITKPFRADRFKNLFPDVAIHKDNPTILYCP